MVQTVKIIWKLSRVASVRDWQRRSEYLLYHYAEAGRLVLNVLELFARPYSPSPVPVVTSSAKRWDLT